MNLVTHILARQSNLPPIQAAMYEYVLAGNGVFVRGRREGLSATIPVAACYVHGLAHITPGIALPDVVPVNLVERMLSQAKWYGRAPQPRETLFHLTRDVGWALHEPPQERGAARVQPIEPCPTYARALIEVHSHHSMQARFSGMDDADETGFRVYAVLGTLFERPTLRSRVGLYGNFWQVPAAWVFDLPDSVEDAVSWDEPTMEGQDGS